MFYKTTTALGINLFIRYEHMKQTEQHYVTLFKTERVGDEILRASVTFPYHIAMFARNRR